MGFKPIAILNMLFKSPPSRGDLEGGYAAKTSLTLSAASFSNIAE